VCKLFTGSEYGFSDLSYLVKSSKQIAMQNVSQPISPLLAVVGSDLSDFDSSPLNLPLNSLEKTFGQRSSDAEFIDLDQDLARIAVLGYN